MKKIFYTLFVAVILTSCSSTFFYSTINCFDERTTKEKNGDFLLENDSLWIAYSFRGQNAPVQITVFNKMNKPLYVDWQRSALIIKDVAYPYAGNTANLSGGSASYSNSYGMNGYVESFTQSNFGGAVELPKNVSFIPPQTMISHSTLSLNVSFESIDNNAFKKASMADKAGITHRIGRIDYTEEDTPFTFRSYLTTYTRPENPVVYNQEFYVKNILKTKGMSPTDVSGSFVDRGDLFYIEKPADNRFGEILLGTTLLVGVAALDATIKKNTPE